MNLFPLYCYCNKLISDIYDVFQHAMQAFIILTVQILRSFQVSKGQDEVTWPHFILLIQQILDLIDCTENDGDWHIYP